jgi:hypothetical protein
LVSGAIFSAVGTLEVVTSLLANVMTSWIYAATVTYMRGLVFLTVGGFDGICIVLLMYIIFCYHFLSNVRVAFVAQKKKVWHGRAYILT